MVAFWDLDHKLFRSTNETFSAHFIAGDVFNPNHLEAGPVLNAPLLAPRLALSTLTSLNPLRGHVSAIYAGNFFHLFSEEQQTVVARAFAGHLSLDPGSMIMGEHNSAEEKGFRTANRGESTGIVTQFCHSPESWKELWDGEVFEKGTVKVDTVLRRVIWQGAVFYFLQWSVTRL